METALGLIVTWYFIVILGYIFLTSSFKVYFQIYQVFKYIVSCSSFSQLVDSGKYDENIKTQKMVYISGFEITKKNHCGGDTPISKRYVSMKNHCDGDIFEHSFKL